MKKASLFTLLIGILIAALILLSSFEPKGEMEESASLEVRNEGNDILKKSALKILQSKCNLCHRKKNPFMIFNEKNMAKRAPKIYKAVFIDRRMPKGNEVQLTQEEYTKLEKWLFTQQIF